MTDFRDIPPEQVTRALTYAGFVMVGYELIKGMVVDPIKNFYSDTTFGNGMPFKSYKEDVRFRHKKEFEACLYYLCDFMEALNFDDVRTILEFRNHRNDMAHELPSRLSDLDIGNHEVLLEDVDHVIFKLSNYRAYMEIGSDPKFKDIDWSTAIGHEYSLYQAVVEKVKLLSL
jgi:hypothetical protein